MIGRLYIDDSRDGQQQSNFVLAGFHSNIEKWKKFDASWAKELSKGPIPIGYFTAKEATRLRGQFDKSLGWNRELRDDKMINLSKIIIKHCGKCFYAHVNPSEKDEAVAKIAYFGNDSLYNRESYHFLLSQLILKFYDHMLSKKTKGKQHIILDNQEGYEPTVALIWDLMKRRMTFDGGLFGQSKIVGNTPAFRSDKECLPLQAADFMAWCLRRKHQDLSFVGKVPVEALKNLNSVERIAINIPLGPMKEWTEVMNNNPDYLSIINQMDNTPFGVR